MRLLPLLSLVAVAFASVASAAPVAVLSDPSGDQVVTAGPLADDIPFDQVDLTAVTADLAGSVLDLAITTSAPVTATERLTLRFTVDRGATSYANSTARGTPFTLTIATSGVTGAPGVNLTLDGNLLHLLVPMASIDAVGGDQLGNVTLTAADTSEGSAPDPVTQDDSSALDRAPDAGAASFTVPRPPIQAGVRLLAQGGTLRDAAGTTGITGASATTASANATLTFDLLVSNVGTDPDVVAIALPPKPAGVSDLRVNPQSIALTAGQVAPVTVTVQLTGPAPRDLTIPVVATSARGGTSQVDLSIELTAVPPPPAKQRTPVPPALAFLTPLAEAVHLDDALGEYAELALLLFFLLLAVAVVFLALFLVRTPYVAVTVSPKRAVVTPGGSAEFRVEVSPRKRKVASARGVLHADGAGFLAALSMGGSRRGLEESVDLAMPADDGPMEGTLRIQVPADATEKDRQTVEFNVVPLGEDGTPMSSHRGRAKVEVKAQPTAKSAVYASARDIQLADVRHSPPSPRPGSQVATTATIHNDGSVPAQLRVVLQLDTKTVAEERIEVPPRGSRQVTLAWTAGAGRNQVKVQVFLA
ncbi:MAG: hypothetical protein QOD77_1191 [Thermoplasmata archaeon]|jgi:hypothetical protein|nr:hypothetical protein [Thermoplasmata archaeon]